MTFATLFASVVALLPAAALAQTTFSVQVGPNGTLTYDPPFITANAGDLVRFTFNPKNHTVTQSSFDAPCVPLAGGATSGFHFISNVSGLLDTWEFAIPASSTPFWFHCEQTQPVSHCGKGMVFAINAPADPDPHSFDAFQKLAMQLNGTGDSTSQSASAPPSSSWATATATITHDGSTWTSVYTSYDGTPSPTYSPDGPVNHVIKVGADGLNYTPSNISAAIGDTVTFEFHPKNHTVTQSSFLQPCKALAETSTTGQVGFKSGFKFVDANETNFPTFQITINDTAPIWGYCGQTGHCQSGMVFSINAVEAGKNNFAAFKALAMAGAPSSNSPSGSNSAGAPNPSTGAAVANNRLSYAIVLGAVGAVAALL
ncbi:Cupredoxin [Favolaschia claudopus]|uniref:Cupredoxin n=1 Tax=Favolaschia claudopus TaxID=2862362 RepID=A0AAW0EB48_9AGAR